MVLWQELNSKTRTISLATIYSIRWGFHQRPVSRTKTFKSSSLKPCKAEELVQRYLEAEKSIQRQTICRAKTLLLTANCKPMVRTLIVARLGLQALRNRIAECLVSLASATTPWILSKLWLCFIRFLFVSHLCHHVHHELSQYDVLLLVKEVWDRIKVPCTTNVNRLPHLCLLVDLDSFSMHTDRPIPLYKASDLSL